LSIGSLKRDQARGRNADVLTTFGTLEAAAVGILD
jgi:hypothetical protein